VVNPRTTVLRIYIGGKGNRLGVRRISHGRNRFVRYWTLKVYAVAWPDGNVILVGPRTPPILTKPPNVRVP